MNDIVLFKEMPSPAVVFASGGGKTLVEKIREECMRLDRDISTPEGRKNIASVAYKIAKTKTALDDMGKQTIEEHQVVINAVNKERKVIRDELDALKEEFRKPLTEFEQAEEKRIADAEQKLDFLGKMSVSIDGETSDMVAVMLEKARTEWLDYDWREFADRAAATRKNSVEILERRHAAMKKAEDDAKRLAELEAAEAERKKKEAAEAEERRLQKIKDDAAAAAKKQAEEKAEQDRIKAENEAKAEQKRLADIAAEEQRKREESEARAKKAEEDRIVLEKKVEADKQAAAEKAKRDEEAAVERERQRAADAKKAEDDEAARRAADKEHRKKINTAAADAIKKVLEGSMFKDGEADLVGSSRAIIEAIVKSEIPQVSIKY